MYISVFGQLKGKQGDAFLCKFCHLVHLFSPASQDLFQLLSVLMPPLVICKTLYTYQLLSPPSGGLNRRLLYKPISMRPTGRYAELGLVYIDSHFWWPVVIHVCITTSKCIVLSVLCRVIWTSLFMTTFIALTCIHRKNFWAFIGPKMKFGLILLILNMIRHGSFIYQSDSFFISRCMQIIGSFTVSEHDYFTYYAYTHEFFVLNLLQTKHYI